MSTMNAVGIYHSSDLHGMLESPQARKERCRSAFATAAHLLFYNTVGIDPYTVAKENDKGEGGLIGSLRKLMPDREALLRARRRWSKRLQERERANRAQLNLASNSQLSWSH